VTEHAVCGVCSSLQVPCPDCVMAVRPLDGSTRMCRTCVNNSGLVCPNCTDKPEALRGSGWAIGIPLVGIKPYKDQVRALLDETLGGKMWSAAMPAKSGKVNWEAWAGEWHVGIEESKSGAEGGTIFMGMAETCRRRFRVRLPSAWVDRIRQVVCPEREGKSF
jgi:hypothetical protein